MVSGPSLAETDSNNICDPNSIARVSDRGVVTGWVWGRRAQFEAPEVARLGQATIRGCDGLGVGSEDPI